MHLDEGTIHAWLDGALDAEEAARVERHAAECVACGAAVAEARGLIAGASRILTALDSVPAGVVPRTSATSGGGSSGRRPRTIWTTLHLTPVRAAAAAVIILAAGSALVITNKPNGHQGAGAPSFVSFDKSTAGAPSASRAVAPLQAPAAAGADTAAAPRTVATVAAPARHDAARGEQGQLRKQKLEPLVSTSVTASANVRAEPRVAAPDSVSTNRRAQAQTDSVVADRSLADAAKMVAPAAAPPAAAGAAPRPVIASRAASVRGFAAGGAAMMSVAGCYAVSGDSSLALPERISLDTVATNALAGQRAAVAEALSRQRHPVSAIVDNTRRPLEDSYWQPLPTGLRIAIGGSQPRVLMLTEIASSELTGTATVGNRTSAVTLRRVDCRL